jgi:hypothetical protein
VSLAAAGGHWLRLQLLPAPCLQHDLTLLVLVLLLLMPCPW